MFSICFGTNPCKWIYKSRCPKLNLVSLRNKYLKKGETSSSRLFKSDVNTFFSLPNKHFLCPVRFDIGICWTSANDDESKSKLNQVTTKWIHPLRLYSIASILRAMRSSVSAESVKFNVLPIPSVWDLHLPQHHGWRQKAASGEIRFCLRTFSEGEILAIMMSHSASKQV